MFDASAAAMIIGQQCHTPPMHFCILFSWRIHHVIIIFCLKPLGLSFDFTLIADMAARARILSVEDRKKLIEGAFDGK